VEGLTMSNADEQWLNAVYEDVLGRPIDSQALQNFETEISDGFSLGQIAYQIVTSPESCQDLVTSWYVQYLGRTPDSGELTTLAGALSGGTTVEQVEADILGSPEYFQNAGGTDTGFVTALYHQLLNRSPTGSETTDWVAALQSQQTSTSQVALDILTSSEYIGDEITALYAKFLGRAPTGAELDSWTNLMKYGDTQYQTVLANILGSAEFFNDAQTPCYARGTLIRTEHGEVPVEDLAIGDEVTTKAGEARPIKWIGQRSYSGRFVMGRMDILPVCIKAGALDDNVPRRDLWISPRHAMYLDGVLIEAKDLINGVSIVQAARVANIEYFHIELETHDVIIAEGAHSETYIDDDNRLMFHNAPEYHTLYPDFVRIAARYCAPRCEDGYEIETARRRIALRAGLLRAADEPVVSGLRGFVDRITARRIAGWAQNTDHPEAPVCLDIYSGTRPIGRVIANRYRADLERAGLGSGRHSFEFTPATGLAFVPEAVEVRRSLDGATLERSFAALRSVA